MTDWELARYLIDAKKNIDSLLFIQLNIEKLTYLNIKEKAGLECELIGYNNLDKKDKETIENLIMFFNKQSK